MTAASALVSGPDVGPQMAEEAVRQALSKAGLDRAQGVFLLLSRDFSKQVGPALRAASRTAGCLQVIGLTVPGLFTESGWVLDQPAAAALVLGGNLGIAPSGDGLTLSLTEDTSLPTDWLNGRPRFGLLHRGSVAWQQARVTDHGRAESVVCAPRFALAVASGVRCLGPAEPVTAVRALDLQTLGDQIALDSLLRLLPAELRGRTPLPIHLLSALIDGRTDLPSIPLLAANADGSVTLAQPLRSGQSLAWGLRQPIIAENDMRSSLEQAANAIPDPSFAIMFSCIGRGPLFYDGDDRDLALWREHFPGVALIGAYGSGQLATSGGNNQLWQNAAVTALFGEAAHV